MRHVAGTGLAGVAVSALLVTGCGTDDRPGVVDDVDEAIADETDVSREELVEDAEEAIDRLRDDVDEVLNDPETFLGEELSVDARVEEVLGENAFTVTSAESPGESLLVLTSDAAPEEGAEVSVRGTLEPDFTVSKAEDALGVDLDDAQYERFTGDFFVHASSGG